MTILFISEFSALREDERGGLTPIPLVPTTADQTVAIGAASAASVALNDSTRMVRVTALQNCNIHFGTTPVATATTLRLSAGAAEYFGVLAGRGLKIAVIAAAA